MATIINATPDRITVEGKPDDLLSLWLRITDEIIEKDHRVSGTKHAEILEYMVYCLFKGYLHGFEIYYERPLTDEERKAWLND